MSNRLSSTPRHARANARAVRNYVLATLFMSAGWGFLPAGVSSAHAQAMGAPPADAAPMVTAPAPAAAAPKIEKPLDGTTASLAAGGQLATGNSRMVALTANGAADKRWNANALGTAVLANYGRSAAPGAPLRTTAQNVQGRVRYDRFLIDQASLFLINTGRHDRFQGLDIRYNLDPGFKYLFVNQPDSAIWAEAGYDLQHDVRRDDARVQMGTTTLLDKTATDHSSRLYVGNKHAFNDAVSFSTGLEYLQSLVNSKHSRLNYDAVFTGKIGAGLSLGFGFNARYDHAPLAGKKGLDTATTVSLIYAYSDVVPPEPPPTCPAPTCPADASATTPVPPAPAAAPPEAAPAASATAAPAALPGASEAPAAATVPASAATAPAAP